MTTFDQFREICSQDKSIEDLAFEVDTAFTRGQLMEIWEQNEDFTETEDVVMDQIAEWM